MAKRAGNDAAVAQFDHARSAVNTAMSGPHVGQRVHGRGLSVARVDVGTPQVFTQHPLISSVNPNEVGLENYATNQATPVNPASWDGETSASAPAVTKAY